MLDWLICDFIVKKTEMLEYIYFCFGLNNLLNQEEKTIEYKCALDCLVFLEFMDCLVFLEFIIK